MRTEKQFLSKNVLVNEDSWLRLQIPGPRLGEMVRMVEIWGIMEKNLVTSVPETTTGSSEYSKPEFYGPQQSISEANIC